MRVARTTYPTANRFQHNNKHIINDQTSFSFFPNSFLGVRGADTLYVVVGSYHDPTACKVSLPNRRF
jgi:hypothetical protein